MAEIVSAAGGRSSTGPVPQDQIETAACRRKVLHFIDSGGIYGAEKVILNLALEMQKDPSYQPVVGCIVQKPGDRVALAEKTRSLGMDAVEVVIHNRFFPLHLVAAARRLKNLGIDLIHSHGYKPSVFGYFMSKLMGVPVLATCHLWFAGENPPLKYRIMTRLELLLYRYFRKIVCVSPQIRDILLEKGISERQLTIIDNGIPVDVASLDRSQSERVQARQALGLADDDFVILNVGRLSEQKGQSHIIELAQMMRAKGEAAVFLIAGEGEQREILEQAIADRRLQNMVRLLGFRDDIASLLKAADVFFMPSLDEGLPISLLEAMASGVPTVVTPVGAIPQLITHDQEGILVNANDTQAMYAALSRARSSPETMSRLAGNALKKVRQAHSSESMYRHYRSVYDELMGSA